jgi:diguanylate cyclase (GGDEF)-like protein
MKSAIDITEQQLALLKTLELDSVCDVINSIVCSIANPLALGVLVWDADFHSFSPDRFHCLGKQAEQLEPFLTEFCEKNSDDWDFGNDMVAAEINASEFGDCVPHALQPLLCYKVVDGNKRVAMIFVAGDSSMSTRDLQDHLNQYPLKEAISNAFEVGELRREVDRLRTQYEQLENAYHEEKQNNSPTGVSPTYTFRMEQTDKEKLVYEISNAVRSSLDIAEVLQTAVNKIGATFQLSRCLVLWPMPSSEEHTVYEWFDDSVKSVKEHFFTPHGQTFVRLASTKTAPSNFADENDQHAFNKDFLRQFGFLSGMLVPLIYHDRNIGTLFLQDCMMPREWSIDNTALIGSLADLISVAIEHSNMHEEKKRQAVTDGLTGISNRRHFNDNLEKEFERARRYGFSLSLVVLDLDFLKKINDNYGHHVGDEAIKTIGKVLARECRAVDTAARYGGEEFCLLLPDTDSEDAVNLAERIRKLIAEAPIEGPGTVSASIGVATFPAHADNQEGLFEAADQALYAAKQSGRNRVCIARVS